MKVPSNKECAALAKAYTIAAVGAVPLLIGLVAIFHPESRPEGPADWEWGSLAFVLSFYVLWSAMQLGLLIAVELAGKARLSATVLYILSLASVNFAAFGWEDGLQSFFMFLVVSAVLYVPLRSLLLRRSGLGLMEPHS